MSEIEKAREALVPALRHRFLASGWLSDDADRLAGDDTKKVEAFIRAIAREEIEAAGPWVCGACGAVPSPTCPHRGVAPQCGVLVHAAVNQEGGEANSPGRNECPATGLDKSPPAVEAPAAGDCPHCDGTGLFRGGRAAVQVPKCPRCYGSGKADDVGPRNAVEAGADTEDEEEEWYESAPFGTTALAHQLAEALRDLSSWVVMVSAPVSIRTKTLKALTEARKAGLIE